MTDNTSPSPRNWQTLVPNWVPVALALITASGGVFGGYVSSQVNRAHLEDQILDHEKRITTLEKLPDILNQINNRLYRIEGALGVKPSPQ